MGYSNGVFTALLIRELSKHRTEPRRLPYFQEPRDIRVFRGCVTEFLGNAIHLLYFSTVLVGLPSKN